VTKHTLVILATLFLISCGCGTTTPSESQSYDYSWMTKPEARFTLYTEGQVLTDCEWIADYHFRCKGKRIRLLGSPHYMLVEEKTETETKDRY
jgi:hypothetical protein